jgi:hypothetical protein
LVAANVLHSATNASLAAINTTLAATNASIAATNVLIAASNASLAQIITNTDSTSIYSARNGNVGGFATKVINAITTSTDTYSSGDNIGGIITCSNILRTAAGTAVLNEIQIFSTETQSIACTIDIWSSSPTGSFVNNTAQTMTGTQASWLGQATFLITDFVTTGTISRAHLKNLGIILNNTTGRNVFYTIVTTGTPAWTGGTTGFYVSMGTKQD